MFVVWCMFLGCPITSPGFMNVHDVAITKEWPPGAQMVRIMQNQLKRLAQLTHASSLSKCSAVGPGMLCGRAD